MEFDWEEYISEKDNLNVDNRKEGNWSEGNRNEESPEEGNHTKASDDTQISVDLFHQEGILSQIVLCIILCISVLILTHY